MTIALELRLPAPLAMHLVDAEVAGPAPPASSRSSAPDVLLEIAGSAATVISLLQGPETVRNLVRMIRTWRRDHDGEERVEVTVTDNRSGRQVTVSAPRNSDLHQILEFVKDVCE